MWSPDGQRLAYTVRRAGRHDIWIAGANGAVPRQVTTSGACRAPAWSPDGSWLGFLSAQGGTFDLWTVPLGAEPGAPAGAEPPRWSPPARETGHPGRADRRRIGALVGVVSAPPPAPAPAPAGATGPLPDLASARRASCASPAWPSAPGPRRRPQ